jgi:polyadenylate-binding protein
LGVGFLVFFELSSPLIVYVISLAEFSTNGAATRGVALLDRREFNGRQVHMRLDRSHMDTSTDGCHSVYIGNLPWSVTDQELMELFSSFNPSSCTVLTNMYGRSRGFAIMKFRSEDDAALAIEKMNHSEVAGRKIEVWYPILC